MKKTLVSSSVAFLALGVLAVLGATVQAQSGAPRAPDGKPDLQGTWSFATLTPMQRPKEFGTKAVLTPDEAKKYAEDSRARRNMDTRSGGGAADVSRAYNDFWWDFGKKVVTTRRTSLIIDPPDGRMPALTPEAQKRAAAAGRCGGRPTGPRTEASASDASSASTRGRRCRPAPTTTTCRSSRRATRDGAQRDGAQRPNRPAGRAAALPEPSGGSGTRAAVGRATRWSSRRRISRRDRVPELERQHAADRDASRGSRRRRCSTSSRSTTRRPGRGRGRRRCR